MASPIIPLLNQAIAPSTNPFQVPNIPFQPAAPAAAPAAAPGSNVPAAPAGGIVGTDPGTAATISQYQQAIDNTNAAVNRLPGQLASGDQAIDASFQDALNQLLLSKNQANTAYTGAKNTTATDFVGAKNTIGANAGSTLTGLLRLLGSRGAGGSSAATIQAPEEVGRAATLQRNDAGNTFGANNQALDTNWNDFLTGYNNEVSSAGNQRDQQKTQLEQNIDTNKASLLQSLASLAAQKDQAAGGSGVAAAQPFLDQANSLLDSTSNYTTNPIAYTTSAYSAPSLASYNTNPQAAPTYQGQSATSDYFSPFLASLLGKKQPTSVSA